MSIWEWLGVAALVVLALNVLFVALVVIRTHVEPSRRRNLWHE